MPFIASSGARGIVLLLEARTLRGSIPAPPDAFHVIAKPSGAICNLDCKYCFYLDKESLFAGDTRFRMSDEVLTALHAATLRRSARARSPFRLAGRRTNAHGGGILRESR